MKIVGSLAICGLILASAPAFAQPRTAAQVLQRDDQAELQWAASVVETTDLRRQGQAAVKLFGTAGGDPAMNGLQTYIAFYMSPADGYRIFRIGDFLDYTLVSEGPGRVALSVRENFMNGRTDQIGVRTRRINLSWTPARQGAAPSSVTLR